MSTLVRIINISGPEPIKVMVINHEGTVLRDQIVEPKDEYLAPVSDEQAITITEAKE